MKGMFDLTTNIEHLCALHEVERERLKRRILTLSIEVELQKVVIEALQVTSRQRTEVVE